MNILLHCVYYPPERGGLESHVHDLARGLTRRGCRVSVVTSRSSPEASPRETRDGVEVWRTWFPSRRPAGWTVHTLGSIPRTLAVARGADVVHAQAFPSVVPGAAARGVKGVPLVATFHTSHFLVRSRAARWRWILGRLVALPDHAFAASEEIARVAEEVGGRARRVEALPNGVDTEVFRAVPPALGPVEGPRIVVPRRLVPKNGVEFLVRAVPDLERRLPGLEVVVVGDGPERSRLEALAGELGVGEVVRFLGGRPREEMAGILCSADVAVVPSLMEATSVAALEAMACELPVAASRVGGLPEIVSEGETGTLFPPRDPEALATAVSRLLERPDRRRLGRAARARVVERWSNERLVDRHLEVYEGLVQRARRGGGRRADGKPRVGGRVGRS